MPDFDAYRTPAALPEPPALSGDDLVVARALTALFYGAIAYVVLVILGAAYSFALSVSLFEDELGLVDLFWRGFTGVTFLLHALGGFFLFLSTRSGWLQFCGLVIQIGYIAGGLLPYVATYSRFEDEQTWGWIVPDVVSTIGSTAVCLAIRDLAPERVAAGVQRAAMAGLVGGWIATFLNAFNSFALLDPNSTAFGLWTWWGLVNLASLLDAICLWLAVAWTREELLRAPLAPEDEGIHFEPPAGPFGKGQEDWMTGK